MRIIALTNLFPRPWDPTKATYNKSIFDLLNRRLDLTLYVAVGIVELIKDPRRLWWLLRFGNQGYARFFVALQFPGGLRRFNHLLYFFSLVIQRPSVLFRKDYSIAFGSWIFPDSAALGILAAIHRKPLVTMAVGTDVNQGTFHPSTKRGSINVLRQSKRVVVVSQAMKDILESKGIESGLVDVIPTGVDGEKFCTSDLVEAKLRKGIDPNVKHILFVGNLVPMKGCFELIEAISMIVLRKSFPLQVSIVGHGVAREALAAEIRKFGLEGIVHLRGMVQHDALPEWFQSADVFCLPSHREGLPNVVLEALSCGIPVVATTVGGIPVLVRDSVGCLIDPKNPEQLAAGLEAVVKKRFEPNQIRDSVSQFSWTFFGDQLLETFKKVLEE